MITIKSCARASTKPGQMSMLDRREFRAAMAIAYLAMRSAPALFGEAGDCAGEYADLRAQLLDALGTTLGHVLGQPCEVGLDVAQMAAQHIIMPERALRDIGQTSEGGLQF